jgi:PAS domain S-box-containing protein
MNQRVLPERIHALLIEDSADQAGLIQEFLFKSKSGPFNVECVERLSSGLDLFARGGFDVVLLDLNLPDSHGLETFTRMHARAAQVPIVILSGIDEEEVALAAIRAGAQDYLVKEHMTRHALVRAVLYAIERRHVERALRESEERFRLIMEHANDAIFFLDLNGVVQWASRQAMVVTGRGVNELLGHSITTILAPGSAAIAEARLAAVRRGESVPPLVETEVLQPGGSSVWMELNATSVADAQGLVGRLIVARDITERKRAEEALKLFRVLLDQVRDSIEVIDPPTGRFMDGNEKAWSNLGYARDELLSLTVPDIDPLVTKTVFTNNMQRLRETGETLLLDSIHLRKDGTTFPVEVSCQLVQYDKEKEYVVAIVRDITERKRAENALRESEERLTHALDATTEGVWDWNIRTGEVLFSPRWMASLGYSPEDVPPHVSFWERLVHPEDLPRVREALHNHFEGRTPFYECENRLRMKTGEWRYNLDRGRVVEWDAEGKPLRMVGTDADITERKRAELQLREYTRRMEILSHVSQQINSVLETPVVMRTLVTSAMDLVEGSAGMYGLVQNERMVFHEYNDNGQWRPTDLVCEKGYGVPGWVMTTLKPYVCQDAEHDPHVIPDFQKRWNFYNFVNVPILNANGELLGCLEILNKRDRSPFSDEDLLLLQGLAASAAIALENSQMLMHRKQAEEALRESERRMRAILAGALDAVVGMDVEGIVTYWNPRSEEIFGWTRSEAVGRKMSDMIIPPQHREAHELGLRHFLATGGGPVLNRRIEITALRRDGTEFPVELAISASKSDDSYRFTAFIADITERKQAHEALRKSGQRLNQLLDDRERISRDLHDNIIQMLYAIGLGLEDYQRVLGKGSKKAGKAISRTISDLNAVIRDVRSYIAWSEPKISDGRQLKAAIERLARTMDGTDLLHFRLKVDQAAADKLTPEEAGHVLHIAREAMSNSLRHSQARDGTVALEVRDGNICLVVADAGEGFDAADTGKYGQGLRNMDARAKKLDARLRIVSEPGLGVRIMLDIPMVRKRASAGV